MRGIISIGRSVNSKSFRDVKLVPSFRFYSRDTRRNEPERTVRSEFEPQEVEKIRIPYFRENTRAEIWNLHKENPEHWDYKRLAQKYGAAMERIRAVCMLMKNREDTMRADGVLDISDEWKSIWALHKEDHTTNTYDVIATELKLDVGTVSKCIQKMTQHEVKLDRLKHYNNL